MLRFKKVIILLSLMLGLLLASIEPSSNTYTQRLIYDRKLIDEESSCSASIRNGKSSLNPLSSIYMPSTTKFNGPQSLGSNSSIGFSTISNILSSFKNLCISPNSENKVASDDRDYYDKLMEALSTKSSSCEVQTLSPSKPLNL